MSGFNWGVGSVGFGGMPPLGVMGGGFFSPGMSLPSAMTAAAYALGVPGFSPGLPMMGAGLGMGLFGAGRDPGFQGVAALAGAAGNLQRGFPMGYGLGGMGLMGMSMPWIGGGFFLGPPPWISLMHPFYMMLFNEWFGQKSQPSAPAAASRSAAPAAVPAAQPQTSSQPASETPTSTTPAKAKPKVRKPGRRASAKTPLPAAPASQAVPTEQDGILLQKTGRLQELEAKARSEKITADEETEAYELQTELNQLSR